MRGLETSEGMFSAVSNDTIMRTRRPEVRFVICSVGFLVWTCLRRLAKEPGKGGSDEYVLFLVTTDVAVSSPQPPKSSLAQSNHARLTCILPTVEDSAPHPFRFPIRTIFPHRPRIAWNRVRDLLRSTGVDRYWLCDCACIMGGFGVCTAVRETFVGSDVEMLPQWSRSPVCASDKSARGVGGVAEVGGHFDMSFI